jgi:hypothetical protein
MEAVVGAAVGIGLAAATGFRVFLPFLVAGLAARWGVLPLTDGFQWLASTGALVALGTARLLETAAYYVPGIDHALDVIAGPAAVVAGIVASASTMADIPPSILWPVAIIGGGGVAGLTKATSALTRASSGVATVGLANPLVATGEIAGALGLSIAAIVIPIVCALVVLVMLGWLALRTRRFLRNRRDTATS